MCKRSLLIALFCCAVSCLPAKAQNLCPPGIASGKLICLIPQVYGVNGLELANIGTTDATVNRHVQNILPESLSPLNSAVARQAALLPLASPSAGIIYSWSPTGEVSSSNDSFGPIYTERAETIGKHRLSLGFNYQHFTFDSVDGVDLKSMPVVFTQPDDSTAVSGTTCSLNPPNTLHNTGSCSFIRDVIRTDNRLDMNIHQFTTFITFGLTNRIDISVAIPIENLRMGVFSSATIVNNSFSFLHQFQDPNCGVVCLKTSFSTFGTASGIGDMILRVKGTAWKGERAAVALGADVRVPTGDALNFLGAGTAGIKPFVVWSYRSRISPHGSVGYETNGSSVLAGNILTGQTERFPGQLTYSGGADIWVTKWFTAAFDLVGQQVFQAQRVSLTTLTEPAACLAPGCGTGFAVPNKDPNLSPSTGTFNITNAALGAKVRPLSNLLVTGNVLVKLNDGGLRGTATPLVGISYTF